MKILILTSSMTLGGAERVACRLANAWTCRGDSVVLMPTFSGRGECFYELSPKVRLVYLADMVPSRTKSVFSRISRLIVLRNFIKHEQPAVVISLLPNVNAATVLATIGLKIPLAICERTDPFARTNEYWLHHVFRLSYCFADALVVQTRAVSVKFLAANRLLRVIWVIQNPIPDNLDGLHGKELRANRPYKTKKIVLAVGRLSNEKQFDLLIRVFAKLHPLHLDWELRIVGDGPLREKLKSQIVSLAMEQCIQLPGTSKDVSYELAQAEIFALTSNFEGFPNALLEAMAAGLSCIAFDCPSGPREMTMNGKTALLVTHNDELSFELELERLMRDDNLRLAFGNIARGSVLEHFGIETILDKWDLLFEEMGVVR